MSSRRISLTLVLLPVISTSADAQGRLFWVNQHGGESIMKADLDGRNVEEVVSQEDEVFQSFGLAIHESFIYFSDGIDGTLMRVSTDGSTIEDIVIGVGAPVPQPAVDPMRGKLLWTQLALGTFQANLDGTSVEPFREDFGGALAIDLVNRKIYATGLLHNGFQIVDADGSAEPTNITVPEASSMAGVAVDPHAGLLFVSDPFEGIIYRARLDGTGVQPIVDVSAELHTSGNIVALAVDPVRRHLYWPLHDADKIQRSNYDGSNIEDFLTAADGVAGPHTLAIEASGEPIPVESSLGQAVLALLIACVGIAFLIRSRRLDSAT